MIQDFKGKTAVVTGYWSAWSVEKIMRLISFLT
jgi:hypothetical protein